MRFKDYFDFEKFYEEKCKDDLLKKAKKYLIDYDIVIGLHDYENMYEEIMIELWYGKGGKRSKTIYVNVEGNFNENNRKDFEEWLDEPYLEYSNYSNNLKNNEGKKREYTFKLIE